jgi:hypothetical protein
MMRNWATSTRRFGLGLAAGAGCGLAAGVTVIDLAWTWGMEQISGQVARRLPVFTQA